MSKRIAFRAFEMANEVYAGASVTLYTVDSDGEKTSTKATLYDGPTGTDTLSNPQTLDTDGKLEQPIYIEQAVIATVTGMGTVDDHDTGLVVPVGNWRGDWATATVYYAGEYVRDGAAGANTGDIIVINQTHASDSYAVDLAAGKLATAIDVSAIADLFDVPSAGGNALKFLRVDSDAGGYELITAATVLTAIGAEPEDSTILKDSDLGVTAQEFDSDILLSDSARQLSTGYYLGSEHDYGAPADSATLTVDLTKRALATVAMANDFTLAPDSSRLGVQYIILTMDSVGGHSLTTTGWDKVIGSLDSDANTVQDLRCEIRATHTILDVVQVA